MTILLFIGVLQCLVVVFPPRKLYTEQTVVAVNDLVISETLEP